MLFNSKQPKSEKPMDKIMSYDGRGEKIEALKTKINTIRSEKENEMMRLCFLSATGSLKVYSLNRQDNYDELRDKLRTLRHHGQIVSFLEKTLENHGVDKFGIRREVGRLHEIVSTTKQEIVEKTYDLQLLLENLESAVNRKLSDDINGDDNYSKISSFILNFNKGKVSKLRIIRHFLYAGKYLIEYVIKDPSIGSFTAHLPINKMGLLKGRDKLLDEIKKTLNETGNIKNKDKKKILEAINKRTNT